MRLGHDVTFTDNRPAEQSQARKKKYMKRCPQPQPEAAAGSGQVNWVERKATRTLQASEIGKQQNKPTTTTAETGLCLEEGRLSRNTASRARVAGSNTGEEFYKFPHPTSPRCALAEYIRIQRHKSFACVWFHPIELTPLGAGGGGGWAGGLPSSSKVAAHKG